MIEALDADKQEAIARKYRNAAMRLRVQALSKQQVTDRTRTHARSRARASARVGGFRCRIPTSDR